MHIALAALAATAPLCASFSSFVPYRQLFRDVRSHRGPLVAHLGLFVSAFQTILAITDWSCTVTVGRHAFSPRVRLAALRGTRHKVWLTTALFGHCGVAQSRLFLILREHGWQ